mgnify:FL=1
MGIINSIGKVFNSVASSPFGNALLTSASRRLSASGLPFGGLFGTQDQNFAINSFDRQGDETDWRVKLTLGGAQNNPLASEMQQPVLQPLAEFGGMVFPITPTILVQHVAHYNAQGLVHTNYPFYAYQNSETMAININGTLPVSNEEEGKYWIATVHFLRTATKMFYGGGDALRGSPPPILRLNGYGDYVFPNVPVVITNFTVELGEDVDYIPVEVTGTNTSFANANTLIQNPITTGANKFVKSTNSARQGKSITRVPMISNLNVQCQPLYSRNEITKNFSLKQFASGGGIKDGFI